MAVSARSPGTFGSPENQAGSMQMDRHLHGNEVPFDEAYELCEVIGRSVDASSSGVGCN